MEFLFGSRRPAQSKADAADARLQKVLKETMASSYRTDSTQETLQKLFLASNDLRERVEVQKTVMQDHIPRAWGALDQATRARSTASGS